MEVEAKAEDEDEKNIVMSSYNSFMDMEVWRSSSELSLKIAQLTKVLPRYEDYALNAQIRRSSNSVSSNIA